MKIIFSLIFSFFFFGIISAQELSSEGKLFIIGGGARPAHMLERLVEESGINDNVYGIILPMASQEPDSAIFYGKKQFENIGITNVHGLHFETGKDYSEKKLDSIKNAALIYISGGDQDRFMRSLDVEIKNAIVQSYSNGATIAGTSAGAAVMSEKMITGNEKKYPEYHSTYLHLEKDNMELKEGMGFLNKTIIDQHFVRRSRYNRLLTAIIEFPELQAIGIDEATAILIKGKQAEVIGDSQVIVFENPQASKLVKDEKIAAKGISLDIYLHGEKFEIK